MILIIDPVGSPLLLIGSARAKLLDIDPLLLPSDFGGL
jgi:hypothetical protein